MSAEVKQKSAARQHNGQLKKVLCILDAARETGAPTGLLHIALGAAEIIKRDGLELQPLAAHTRGVGMLVLTDSAEGRAFCKSTSTSLENVTSLADVPEELDT